MMKITCFCLTAITCFCVLSKPGIELIHKATNNPEPSLENSSYSKIEVYNTMHELVLKVNGRCKTGKSSTITCFNRHTVITHYFDDIVFLKTDKSSSQKYLLSYDPFKVTPNTLHNNLLNNKPL